MKILFKLFMAIHVGLYRLSGGKLGGMMRGFKVLLLTTTGRKSGKVVTTPLGRFDQDGGYVIVASNGGQPMNPAWYYNLKSNPQVTVQVLDKIIPATAEVLSGEARRQAWRQVIATAPAYAAYEKRTTREIPVILLRPNKSADRGLRGRIKNRIPRSHRMGRWMSQVSSRVTIFSCSLFPRSRSGHCR